MSFDVGCGGMWGFPVEAEVIGQPLMDSINRFLLVKAEREGMDGTEAADLLPERIMDRVRQQFFENAGIVIPKEACFGVSESEGNSMSRGDYSILYIGFGMYMQPWKWPVVDESFKAKAFLYTWVWGG